MDNQLVPHEYTDTPYRNVDVSVSEWTFIEQVDKAIDLLVGNQDFIDYIDATNAEIIANPDKFKDISKDR